MSISLTWSSAGMSSTPGHKGRILTSTRLQVPFCNSQIPFVDCSFAIHSDAE
eukprot:CAMPEP_0183463552 /NCGR_PEP_ID=MMETSP0370-20130417/143752_1 /TAXON_ID=268820 /ORGANISM="Peridinium aciculiferum, Strain PAER-2" /LENGTH=51 /DNA_ID=CAMNT_0025655673 /DNA_START=171 /DNA_END=323 /DNA_ORIENTATION=-